MATFWEIVAHRRLTICFLDVSTYSNCQFSFPHLGFLSGNFSLRLFLIIAYLYHCPFFFPNILIYLNIMRYLSEISQDLFKQTVTIDPSSRNHTCNVYYKENNLKGSILNLKRFTDNLSQKFAFLLM